MMMSKDEEAIANVVDLREMNGQLSECSRKRRVIETGSESVESVCGKAQQILESSSKPEDSHENKSSERQQTSETTDRSMNLAASPITQESEKGIICDAKIDSLENSYSLCPKLHELPSRPPSVVDSNYSHYFVIDFTKPGHDQYIYRHANGLCIIGLASTHVAFGENENITAVDYNVGKGNRSEIKVTGKRKKNAHFLEANSALCKIISNDKFYIVRCCIKGSLLEVNERLIEEPQLLKKSAGREGYIAIMMPKPEDWVKAQSYLLTEEEYKRQRGLG